MNEEKIELHAIVKGHVQGVFFRANVCEISQKIGLAGTVRNMEDGTVEIYAQGTAPQLEAFVTKLKQNPGRSRVDTVETKFFDPQRDYTSFKVVY